MIYPDTFEERIGFDQIREMVRSACRNELSDALAGEMTFSSNHEELLTRLGETDEYVRMLTQVYGHPDPVVEHMMLVLEQIRIPGSWFEPEVLPGLHDALSGMLRYLEFFTNHPDFPLLAAMTHGVYVDANLVDTMGSLLDEQGGIRDSASVELARIRKEISGARIKGERMMRKILKDAVNDGIIGKDAGFTLRSGRFVIPVPAARKRQLQGYVHDESATGQTIYIEPAAVMELFNEVRELELAERREIIRILTELANEIRPHLPDLDNAFRYAARLDFIRAKAKLAVRYQGVLPELVDAPMIQWGKAIHPLLFFSLQEQGRKVVPLDIALDHENRILVISGPNAGGKSVCLKTVGLLQYMLQCGLLIPVHHASTAGLFRNLFLDIGDQQSIENDLSTYSSHLLNLRNLLEGADEGTLFLIDEMGSGTEPSAGGAIAEVALERIAASGAYGVVTTHYANLKLMAGRVPGIVNGAMLFDTQKMQPLYLLRIGKPGSSFAFEIAARTGMPETLLEAARDKVGRAHYEFEIQMQTLETEKDEILRKSQELKVADAFVAEMIEKYTALFKKLEGSRREILDNARGEALRIIAGSNKLIEKTVKELREEATSKERIKEIRATFAKEAEQLTIQEPPPMEVKGRSEALALIRKREEAARKAEIRKLKEPVNDLKPGDWVSMKGHPNPGEVLSVNGKKVEVVFGDIRMRVDLNNLERARKPERTRSNKGSVITYSQDLQTKSALFKPDLDVRGLRAEDALSKVRSLVDDAVLLNVYELKVLHGKGDGILRQVIRDFLMAVPEVKRCTDAHPDQGGHGVTLISLNRS